MQQRRRFRILQTLGKGGFGTVYRAELSDAGGFAKQVALKIMSYEGEEADTIARRMRDEARMLGLIRHRAIVGVNSLVPLQDGWGVVMEYVDGVDLSSCIKAGPIPVAAALEVIEEVSGALNAAYTAKKPNQKDTLRLIHRDIKPSNIRVTPQGEVKLLDFGVAHAEFAGKEAEESSEFVMGSTRYMAPERRRGWETHQGDVYALGLVLANALTRKRFPEPPEREQDHARFLGTVLETVRKALAASESTEIRAAASQIRILLLEMLAYEPMDRPDASSIERRIRKTRKSLPAPWLREWADSGVARLIRVQAEAMEEDSDTGRVLVETPSGGPEPPQWETPPVPYDDTREESSSIRQLVPPPTPLPPRERPRPLGVPKKTVGALMAASFAAGIVAAVLGSMLISAVFG